MNKDLFNYYMEGIEGSYIDNRASVTLEDVILSDVRLSEEDKNRLLFILETGIFDAKKECRSISNEGDN